MKDKKNILIGGLIIAIAFGATAFAALAQNLNINGTANVTGSWDVAFTNVTPMNANLATPVGTALLEQTSVTFEVDLAEPGSSIDYQIEVTNGGSIDAKLASITGLDTVNLAAPVDVQYTLTGVSVDDVLLAGNTHLVNVNVEWIEYEDQEVPVDLTKTATITLNYVQNTN